MKKLLLLILLFLFLSGCDLGEDYHEKSPSADDLLKNSGATEEAK